MGTTTTSSLMAQGRLKRNIDPKVSMTRMNGAAPQFKRRSLAQSLRELNAVTPRLMRGK